MKNLICAMLLSSLCALTARGEDVPNPATVRRNIDAGIQAFVKQKKKATLGLVQQSIALSISYGAPAYNTGDRAACFHFYAETADALAAAFADEKTATEAGHRAINDLKNARERTRNNPDADHNAWTMRYAFDKTQMAWELNVALAQGLVRLGAANFQKSQFAESQDAFETALKAVQEFDGQPFEAIPINCRFAALALANAHFAQKDFKSASESVAGGIRYLPEWPAMTLDLRALHHDPAEYESLIEELKAKIKETPTDAALQFLLGYEFQFTGKRAEAREQFEQTLKLDPNHAGAKEFLHPGHKEPEPPHPSFKV